MKPWEKYAQTESSPSEGPWSKYAQEIPPSSTQEPSLMGKVGQTLGNVAAGAVRGAGSIGATLLTPIDVVKDLAAGKGLSLESSRERRQAMDAALQQLGADPESLAYGAGKIGTEIAGTLGAGGAVANVASKIPGVATTAAPLLDAVNTAGMSAKGTAGLKGIATKMAGGAITGGTAAGLINPEDVGTGVVIGAAAPIAIKSVSEVAKLLKSPIQSATVAESVRKAREAGFVVPPSAAEAGRIARTMEGVGGKIKVQQEASIRNANVAHKMATKALNLPEGTPLSPEVLAAVRKEAGDAYDAVSNSGKVITTKGYQRTLDRISSQARKAAEGFPDSKESPVIALIDSLRTKSFDASSGIAKIKELRSTADDAFRTGNTDVARAAKAAANAIEKAIGVHLRLKGESKLLSNFREARVLIAKTRSVEKAMNPSTGEIDMRRLAAELKRGKPLTGELRQMAEFGSSFPKAAQPVSAIGGSPPISPLDFYASLGLAVATGGLSAAAGLARPGARSIALSPLIQNRLVQNQEMLIDKIMNPAQSFAARTFPVLPPIIE